MNVPAGAPAFTACWVGDSRYNYDFDPHFSPGTPITTFFDPDSATVDPNQCGNLEFDNRVRSFETIYASLNADESPYKYWWQRGRRAQTGATDSLDWAVRLRSVPKDTLDTALVFMRLYSEWDAVAALLILEDDSTLTLSEEPFLDASSQTWVGLNLAVQHWAQVAQPTLNSVTVNGNNDVLINWDNNHAGRSIDSTAIYRDGGLPIKIRGPSDTMWVDSTVGVGTHTYTVKHLSAPAARLADRALVNPNSASPTEIEVTVPGACARPSESSGSTNTWKLTDQYLSAGCSELGANKRFRWYSTGGVALTGWTTDTLLEFSGHSSAGAQVVVLKDSNTTSHATSLDTLAFSVVDHRVVLTGPTIIQDKTRKIYRAYRDAAPTTHRGQWFERYEGSWQWYPATSTLQDTLARIWPMGEYTMELRQHRDSVGIHRGRLHIEVCSSPGSQCEQNAPPAGLVAAATEAEGDWGVFGAGPWIGWSAGAARQTLRLYDLWGAHDRDTPFSAATWIDGPGGTVTDPETGWTVSWARRDVGTADVAAFDFTITGGGTRAYVLGLAVDADLGLNAADDQASYDADRGLILVADQTQAVGFLLRRAGDNALSTVQEYGVGRWAPTTSVAAWAAQRAGTQLVGTPRDVQLVLSAPQTVGSGTWQFVVIRGATPTAVRTTADAVLDRLR
jgi:hypothetical protein